jgi:hypothetical protein
VVLVVLLLLGAASCPGGPGHLDPPPPSLAHGEGDGAVYGDTGSADLVGEGDLDEEPARRGVEAAGRR